MLDFEIILGLLFVAALVLVTTAVVALIARAVALELPWASAFVLGAIVAPQTPT